jgi:tRNA-modifying protein YgfZ
MSMPTDALDEPREARGALVFRGPDAAKFLQGQLSADVEKLAPGTATLAGLHNPQGRIVALLDLSRTSDEEIIASLPRDLVPAVGARLRKYVLRARVRIEEMAQAQPVPDPLAAIRAGLPEVYTATSEAFVAQMLNLDLLGAIAFDKGCYTGQEVIARAHYRGRVKRRMQRWRNAGGPLLSPGDSARAADGRSLNVVRVARLPDGGQEILAVGVFSATGEPAPAMETPAPAGVEVSGPLPLPYELPA